MKQILAILTLIASLTFTSCEDFLTEEVRGQQNLDTYFQSVEEPSHSSPVATRPSLSVVGGTSIRYGYFPKCAAMTVGWEIQPKARVIISL